MKFLLQWEMIGGLAAASAPVMAQDYPTKPITIVSAQAPGGASDAVGRAVMDRLQAALGQPIVMENRPGAGGNVDAAGVARRGQAPSRGCAPSYPARLLPSGHAVPHRFEPVAERFRPFGEQPAGDASRRRDSEWAYPCSA